MFCCHRVILHLVTGPTGNSEFWGSIGNTASRGGQSLSVLLYLPTQNRTINGCQLTTLFQNVTSPSNLHIKKSQILNVKTSLVDFELLLFNFFFSFLFETVWRPWLHKNYLLQAAGIQICCCFKGALPGHVRLESSSRCFPMELASFVRPWELVSFDPWHVTCFPQIRKRITTRIYWNI